MKRRIQKFKALREAEDKCVVMQSQMDGIQEQAEEMLEQKDIECQQIIEQVQTECQAMLEEEEREADNDKAKMTRRLRDSGQENGSITEQMRQLQEEIRELKDGKFIDCKFDEGPTILEETKIGKFRNSLGAGIADRTDAGRMVLAFGLSTKPMTRNVYRDKEQDSNVQAIAEAMQLMEVPVSVGWLAPKKLEAVDRQGIEKEIAKYAADTGRAKLTAVKAKDWCNVCRVLIEALGELSATMQRGSVGEYVSSHD